MNYIVSWAGGDNPMGSISSNKGGRSFAASFRKTALIIFVKFHHDTPNSKGTGGQKPFLYIRGRAYNSNGVNFEQRRKLLSL